MGDLTSRSHGPVVSESTDSFLYRSRRGHGSPDTSRSPRIDESWVDTCRPLQLARLTPPCTTERISILMTKFLSLLIPGAVTGALYAIIGIGLVLGYQTSGIFNLGYGAIAFTAAYLFYQLNTGQHLAIVWSALITVVVFAPLMGLLLERLILRRLAHAPVYARIVGTIGLIVALPNLALWIVTLINSSGGTLPTNESVTTGPGLGPTPATYFHILNGVVIDTDQLAILSAAVVAASGLWYLLRHTRLGLVLRANVDRPELAQLRGISPTRVSKVAWVLTATLAGLVGVLIVPLFGLDPNTFTLVVLGSIAAVVVGGLRSLPLVFLGGLLLGVIQNMVAGYANSFLPRRLPSSRDC